MCCYLSLGKVNFCFYFCGESADINFLDVFWSTRGWERSSKNVENIIYIVHRSMHFLKCLFSLPRELIMSVPLRTLVNLKLFKFYSQVINKRLGCCHLC